MLCVGHRITDDIFEKNLEYTTSLLVDETRNTLDAATTSETADGRLGDSLDVVAKNLSVTLSASLSKTFTSFTTTRHDELLFSVLMTNALDPGDSFMSCHGIVMTVWV
eukprot:CCRYP_012983-RB/>CCRYP_012983-RB protein AED:0.44 eAED:0.44 QI:0/-1/0/1/-1/0/1/0/107